MEAPALFIRDRHAFVATTLARGPWNPAHTNGSSAMAILAHCLDDVPTLMPMFPARFTLDLQRPVPVGRRLTVHSRVTREGKKLQVVEMVLADGDQECVRATALRLRTVDLSSEPSVPTGSTTSRPTDRIAPRDQSVNMRSLRDEPSGALLAGDILKAPRLDAEGTATWIRLGVPVVAGEPLRTFAHMAYAFDFTSLIGLQLDISTISMINPDVTAHVLRPAVGDWMALVGDTRIEPLTGRGISVAEACDDEGVFAVVSTSQIVEPR